MYRDLPDARLTTEETLNNETEKSLGDYTCAMVRANQCPSTTTDTKCLKRHTRQKTKKILSRMEGMDAAVFNRVKVC